MKHNPFEEVPLLRLAVCLMVGIVVGEKCVVAVPLLPVFIVAVILALLLWRHEHWQSVAIAVCFILLGWLLMQRQKQSLNVMWPDGEVCRSEERR